MDHAVQNGTTRRFIAALRTLEQDRGLEPMLQLFPEGAELTRLDGRGASRGREGAEHFWTQYRDTFQDINSTFIHVTEGERSASLEWTAHGTLLNGRPIEYVGVSVIEIDGDQVTAFRTYYDSAAFAAGEIGATGSEGARAGEGAQGSEGTPRAGGDTGGTGGPSAAGRSPSHDDADEVMHTGADSGFEDERDRAAARGDHAVAAGEVVTDQ